MKKQATIYAVKTGDTCHYIGKTIKENSKGNVTKSLITSKYKNEKLNNVFNTNDDIIIEPVKLVDVNEWYNEKLQEVLNNSLSRIYL